MQTMQDDHLLNSATVGLISVVENSIFQDRLERTHDIPEIFELVKLAVRKNTGKERSGLMLGLSNLGGGPQGFVGAFYPVATNIIVMNTLPLERIKQTDPSLYKPYVQGRGGGDHDRQGDGIGDKPEGLRSRASGHSPRSRHVPIHAQLGIPVGRLEAPRESQP